MTRSAYMTGFGNHFSTEAIAGTLPDGQNAPQKPARGLYTEQISGTAFTAPRAHNRRTWTYRIRPSVMHPPYVLMDQGKLRGTPFDEADTPPNQLRWDPLPLPVRKTDFIDGLMTVAGNGDSYGWTGLAVHLYAANISMNRRFFYSADGEFLFVPQHGALALRTELGVLDVRPGEIAVVPRGIKFAVDLPEGDARGYICENFGAPFQLPDLGPIGANGLANPRDFLTPVAAFEDSSGPCDVVAKLGGKLWRSTYDHSPLNIVAWHGNYAPYKYDLMLFNTINTVSYDHPDPSIFTVLTAPGETPGTANVDFVIFPPRWMVAEHSFRPPWFHRNVMSEFMGLIHGVYDGKEGESGGTFAPGGYSIHNCMSGHGADGQVVEKAMAANLQPHKIENTLAFMFESRYVLRPTRAAMTAKTLQKDYWKAWQGIQKLFR